MPRGPVVYTLPPGTTPQIAGTTIEPAVFNAAMDDIANTFNTVQPPEYGGTGGSSKISAANSLEVLSYNADQTLTDSQLAQAYENAKISWETVFSGSVPPGASFPVIDLAPFRILRFRGALFPATNSVNVFARLSTNNGSSYDAAANYPSLITDQTNGAPSPAGQYLTADAGIRLNSGAVPTVGGIDVDLTVSEFNQARRCSFKQDAAQIDAALLIRSFVIRGSYTGTTARNAIQFIASSGNISGWMNIEGVRG